MDASNDTTTEIAKSEFADALAQLIDDEGLTVAGLRVTGTDVRGGRINIVMSNGQGFRAMVEEFWPGA